MSTPRVVHPAPKSKPILLVHCFYYCTSYLFRLLWVFCPYFRRVKPQASYFVALIGFSSSMGCLLRMSKLLSIIQKSNLVFMRACRVSTLSNRYYWGGGARIEGSLAMEMLCLGTNVRMKNMGSCIQGVTKVEVKPAPHKKIKLMEISTNTQ